MVIMAKVGCPPRFTAVVQQFHNVMQACVQNCGELTEPFEVTNGVKQGCVMALTLFYTVQHDVSARLTDAF